MGGKSRKSGRVSKALIDRLKAAKARLKKGKAAPTKKSEVTNRDTFF